MTSRLPIFAPDLSAGDFYSVCKSRNSRVLSIADAMGGDAVCRRESRCFPVFNNKHLEFLQKMPIIIGYLPPRPTCPPCGPGGVIQTAPYGDTATRGFPFPGFAMPHEPPAIRVVAFVDGQNLFHSAREAFGYTYPNYDVGLKRMVARFSCHHANRTPLFSGVFRNRISRELRGVTYRGQ